MIRRSVLIIIQANIIGAVLGCGSTKPVVKRNNQKYIYAVKFYLRPRRGRQIGWHSASTFQAARYSTVVNVHNFYDRAVRFTKKSRFGSKWGSKTWGSLKKSDWSPATWRGASHRLQWYCHHIIRRTPTAWFQPVLSAAEPEDWMTSWLNSEAITTYHPNYCAFQNPTVVM